MLDGVFELPSPDPFASERTQPPTGGVEHLHSVIAGVRNVDSADRIRCDSRWHIELTGVCSRSRLARDKT